MATSFTSNLGLKLSSKFSDELLFNFKKLDELATVYQTNIAGSVTLRSKGDIVLEPNSADLGASVSGGTVQLGSADSPVSSFTVHSDAVDFQDAAVTGLAGVSDLTDANISATAAIAGTKISPAFGAQIISTSDSLQFLETFSTTLRGAQSGQIAALTFTLPSNAGSAGQVLSTDGAGNLSFITVAGGGGTVAKSTHSWLTTDSNSMIFTHNLGTRSVVVSVYDENYDEVEIDEIERTTTATITLTRSETGSGTWTVVVVG